MGTPTLDASKKGNTKVMNSCSNLKKRDRYSWKNNTRQKIQVKLISYTKKSSDIFAEILQENL